MGIPLERLDTFSAVVDTEASLRDKTPRSAVEAFKGARVRKVSSGQALPVVVSCLRGSHPLLTRFCPLLPQGHKFRAIRLGSIPLWIKGSS